MRGAFKSRWLLRAAAVLALVAIVVGGALAGGQSLSGPPAFRMGVGVVLGFVCLVSSLVAKYALFFDGSGRAFPGSGWMLVASAGAWALGIATSLVTAGGSLKCNSYFVGKTYVPNCAAVSEGDSSLVLAAFAAAVTAIGVITGHIVARAVSLRREREPMIERWATRAGWACSAAAYFGMAIVALWIPMVYRAAWLRPIGWGFAIVALTICVVMGTIGRRKRQRFRGM